MKENGGKTFDNARFQRIIKAVKHGNQRRIAAWKILLITTAKISLIEDMMIPMNERSSYFGDGVYDAMFTVDHVPLQLDDHRAASTAALKKI